MNGPVELLYVITVLSVLMTIAFFRGKGSFLIAGYNTASKEEKQRYDEKKLCTVMGGCFTVIDILLVVMCIFEKKLPEIFGGIFAGIVIADVIVTIILTNTICRK